MGRPRGWRLFTPKIMKCSPKKVYATLCEVGVHFKSRYRMFGRVIVHQVPCFGRHNHWASLRHLEEGQYGLTWCTVIGARMSHWKWRETKLQPCRARSGHQISCCLVSLHFLRDILAPIMIQDVQSGLGLGLG